MPCIMKILLANINSIFMLINYNRVKGGEFRVKLKKTNVVLKPESKLAGRVLFILALSSHCWRFAVLAFWEGALMRHDAVA